MVRAEVDGICRERGSPCDRGEKVAGPPDPQTTRGTRARQSWQQRRYPSHVVPHLPLLWLLPIPMRDLMPSHEGGARLSIEREVFFSRRTYPQPQIQIILIHRSQENSSQGRRVQTSGARAEH